MIRGSVVVLGFVLGASALTGCASAPIEASAPDAAAFIEARSKLEELRKQASVERTESISLELDAPYIPSAVTARGAVAVRPPGSLRMILVGPGGTTAMDLWMRDGHFRFDVPAMKRVITGAPSERPETRKGLPVEFLKWWMFEPLGGRLLSARRVSDGLEVLLDEPGRSTIATLKKDGSVSAHRRWVAPGDRGRFQVYEEEWLDATAIGCAVATYRQKSTSLKVVAKCESSKPEVNEAAFEEPKQEGG